MTTITTLPDRERRSLLVSYEAPAGSIVLDKMGRVIGQVVGSEQVGDKWRIQVDVDIGTDLEQIQVMATYGITGSING